MHLETLFLTFLKVQILSDKLQIILFEAAHNLTVGSFHYAVCSIPDVYVLTNTKD